MVILDSGTSYVMMPQSDYKKLIQMIANLGIDFDSVPQTKLIKMVQCSADQYDELPDIKIQLNDHVYTLPKSSYMLFFNGDCYLMVLGKNFGFSSGMWILGNNFLHNYYTIYDVQNLRIGLVPSNLATGLPETSVGDVPIMDKPWFQGLLWLVIIGSTVFLVVFVYRQQIRNETNESSASYRQTLIHQDDQGRPATEEQYA